MPKKKQTTSDPVADAIAAPKSLTIAELAREAGCSSRTVMNTKTKYPQVKDWDQAKFLRFLKLRDDERKVAIETWDREDDTPGTGDDIGFRMCFPPSFGDQVTGLREEVAKLPVAIAAARKEWARLAGLGHKDEAKARSAYLTLLDSYRQVAKDTPKALREMNDSIGREEYEKWIGGIFTAIDRRLHDFAVAAAGPGANLPQEDLEEVLVKEVESVRLALRNGSAWVDVGIGEGGIPESMEKES